MEKTCWHLDIKCWCGKFMATNGKKKWCSAKKLGEHHDKHENGGRTDPVRIDNHFTHVRPRSS